jgi:hypothetical protein
MHFLNSYFFIVVLIAVEGKSSHSRPAFLSSGIAKMSRGCQRAGRCTRRGHTLL